MLDRLTLRGGLFTLVINNGGRVVLQNSQVLNSSFHGVFVDDGAVRLQNTTVDGHPGSGVFAWVGSTVRMGNSIIQNTGNVGLALHHGATAQVGGGSRFTSNRFGVGLYFGAILHLQDATVENSIFAGVIATGGSVALLSGSLIRTNGGDGIILSDTSVVGFEGGTGQIINNGGFGIHCSGPPAVAQISTGLGGIGTVSGNAAGQIACPISP